MGDEDAEDPVSSDRAVVAARNARAAERARIVALLRAVDDRQDAYFSAARDYLIAAIENDSPTETLDDFADVYRTTSVAEPPAVAPSTATSILGTNGSVADSVLSMVHAFDDRGRKDAVRALARKVAALEAVAEAAERVCMDREWDMHRTDKYVSALVDAIGALKETSATCEVRRSAETTQRRLTRNAARCKLCNDTIESTHVHDYKKCSCGSLMVDGGLEYVRRGGNPENYIDLDEYEDTQHGGDQ